MLQDTTQKVKKKEGTITYANQISDKELVSRIYEELLKLENKQTNKKTDTPI